MKSQRPRRRYFFVLCLLISWLDKRTLKKRKKISKKRKFISLSESYPWTWKINKNPFVTFTIEIYILIFSILFERRKICALVHYRGAVYFPKEYFNSAYLISKGKNSLATVPRSIHLCENLYFIAGHPRLYSANHPIKFYNYPLLARKWTSLCRMFPFWKNHRLISLCLASHLPLVHCFTLELADNCLLCFAIRAKNDVKELFQFLDIYPISGSK